MKFYKNKLNTGFLLGLLVLILSCQKNIFETKYPGHEGRVYLSQAVEGRNNFNLPLIDEPWILFFGASYGGLTVAPQDLNIEFALKEAWIANYNQSHGTSYIPLPTGSYSISGLNSVLNKGGTSSQPLQINIHSKKLNRTLKYMFPITIVSASGQKMDSALQTAWFRIDTIIRKETDITGRGKITVLADNSNANEGSAKLVDGNFDTKFLTFNYTPQFWMQLAFSSPEVLGAYVLVSGNDAHDRDPKNWKLVGSNDLNTWTELHTVTNTVFSSYKQVERYEFDNTQAFQYYRINVTERFGGGNGLFQLSEWRVIAYD